MFFEVFFSRLVLMLGGFLFFLSFAQPVSAFEVRPATLEVSSVSSSAIFLLRNDEDREQTFIFTIQGFEASDMDGRPQFLPPDQILGLPSWLFLSKPSVTLKPQEEASVSVAFRPSVEARPGSYQAVIFATAKNGVSQEGIVLGSRVGILVFANIAGDVRRDFLIRSFTRTSFVLVSDGSAKFATTFENRGDVIEVPRGRFSITNLFGRDVLNRPLSSNDEIKRVLPRSKRTFLTEIHSLSLGIYRVELEVDGFEKGMPPSVIVFVLPWKVPLFIFLVLFLIVFLWRRW